jgi:hypothetical protein
MLKAVDNPNAGGELGQGVMVTPEGGYVVAEPDLYVSPTNLVHPTHACDAVLPGKNKWQNPKASHPPRFEKGYPPIYP